MLRPGSARACHAVALAKEGRAGYFFTSVRFSVLCLLLLKTHLSKITNLFGIRFSDSALAAVIPFVTNLGLSHIFAP